MTASSEPIRDSLGHVLERACGEPAIASLAPAISATLVALGLGPLVVARTESCRDIDEELAAATTIGPVGRPDIDRLVAAAPSHALLPIALRDAALEDRLKEAGIVPVFLGVAKVADNFALIRLLGELFDRVPDADGLARKLESAIARARMAMRKARDLRIVYIDRLEPPTGVAPDSYTADLLALVRMKVIGTESGLALDLDGALLLGADGVLFNGARGRFRRAEIRAFAERQHVDPAHCLPLFADPAELYGVELIEAIDELLALRDRLTGPA